MAPVRKSKRYERRTREGHKCTTMSASIITHNASLLKLGDFGGSS